MVDEDDGYKILKPVQQIDTGYVDAGSLRDDFEKQNEGDRMLMVVWP